MKYSRRKFLQRLAGAGVISSLSGLDTIFFSSALSQAAGSDYRALVCIYLLGGNDGNNTVIPAFGENYVAYSTARKTLAIPEQDLIPLTSSSTSAYALHPELQPLKQIWDDGAMAILLNVGTLAEPLTKASYASGRVKLPQGLYSHLDQQSLWQGGGANSFLRSGWGGRIADRLGQDMAGSIPIAISVAGDSLYITGNATKSLIVPSTGSFSISGSGKTVTDVVRRDALQQLLAIDRDSLLIKGAGDVIADALAASDIIDPLITSESSAAEPFFAGQQSSVAKQLLQVARLIEGRTSLGVRRQIFFVTQEGYDTHKNQLNTQSTLFAQLAPALRAFYEATVQLGIASQVTTFTLSDFGRTLQPNTGKGTDHGWGSHHIVIGDSIRGRQFYGEYPVMALDGPSDAGNEGRWIPTISVDQYAATLAAWLGVSASDLPLVVPNIGRFPTSNLGFMA